MFSTLILHIGIENILIPSQDFALEAICEAKNSQNVFAVFSECCISHGFVHLILGRAGLLLAYVGSRTVCFN